MFVDLPERTPPTFLLNCHLYIEQRTVLLNFLHHHNFPRNVRTLLFGDSPKSQAQNILLSKAVPTTNHWRNITPTPILLLIPDIIVFYIINVYILIIRYALCQTYACLHDTGEHFIYVVKLVFNPILYIWQ